MVDMVANDMAWNGAHNTVDYSYFDVFNDSSLYHPYCPVTDYQNATNAEECWTGDDYLILPDLNTENALVVSKWQSWVSNITQFYGIDGIRLDACLELNKPFFTSFESAAGVYMICEVYNYPIASVCDYQNYVSGLLNFPLWYLVIDAFQTIQGSIANLYNGITQVQGSCKDVSLLGNFVENHDVNRFAYNTTDAGLDQNAIAFVMLNDGIPIIYAGEEQHYNGSFPPSDRETTWTSNYDTTNVYYQLIKKINLFRNCVIARDPTYVTTNSVPFFQDTQVLAVKKGSSAATQVVGVFNNRGIGAVAYTINMTNTGFTAGQQVFEVYTEQTVTVTPQGELPVYMYGGQPRIYYLLSSGCTGNGSTSPLTTSGSTTAIQSSTSMSLPSTNTAPIVTTTSVLPTSTTSISSPATSPSVRGSSSSSAILSSPTTSSAVASSVFPSSFGQISSSSTSSSGLTSSNPVTNPVSTSSVLPGSTVPGTSSLSSVVPLSSSAVNIPGTSTSASLLPTSSHSTVPTPATTPPVCPSADGGSFASDGHEFVVGCGIGSDQTHYAQQPGHDISDCVHICVTYTGTPACEAVTFTNGVCYLKSSPGAVHHEDGSDSAFVISSPSGPETVVSGFLSGNISYAAPACPAANGNTFESNGYVYVVGCSTDNFVVDISASPGADLATCVESCITFSGTTACVAVTHNNGTCHLKGSVGTVYHADGADTVFIIANPAGVNPAGVPTGLPASSPPTPTGPPSLSPNLAGNGPLPNHSDTYTMTYGCEVIVYMPSNETCPA